MFPESLGPPTGLKFLGKSRFPYPAPTPLMEQIILRTASGQRQSPPDTHPRRTWPVGIVDYRFRRRLCHLDHRRLRSLDTVPAAESRAAYLHVSSGRNKRRLRLLGGMSLLHLIEFDFSYSQNIPPGFTIPTLFKG